MSSLFRRGASQQSMPTFTPPTHLPSGSGRSISSFSRHTRVPSKATSLTYLWLFLSLLAMYGGWRICGFEATSVLVTCSPTALDSSSSSSSSSNSNSNSNNNNNNPTGAGCIFKERTAGRLYTSTSVPKPSLTQNSVRQVRVTSDGRLVDIEKLSRREKRKLNYAYAVDYTVFPDRRKGGKIVSETVVLGKHGLGRKRR